MLESRFTPYTFASARSTSSTVKLLEQDHGANHPIRSAGYHLAPRRGERCEKLQVAPRIGDIGETAPLARWPSAHQLGIFSVASIPANRRPPSVSLFPTRHLTRPAAEYFHSSVTRTNYSFLPHSGLVRSGLDGHRFHQCSLDTRKPMLNECDPRTGMLTDGSFQR